MKSPLSITFVPSKDLDLYKGAKKAGWHLTDDNFVAVSEAFSTQAEAEKALLTGDYD